MFYSVRTLMSVAALAALAACSNDSPLPPSAPGASANQNNGLAMRLAHARVCPSAAPGFARCHSLVRVDDAAQPLATSGPSGWGPADLRSAYSLAAAATSNGVGQTIAIVDAFDDGNAESDLAVYRAQFGLPACTTANGCFRKVDQNGGQSYPRGDASWAEQISLDLDMASAICPNCKILLVEARTNSLVNLYTAVDRAAAMGATVISNSYGGPEYSGEVSAQSAYNHPGIAITVSSGDAGYGVEIPPASQDGIAVGGPSLRRATSSRGFTETVWSGAGSGCSVYIAKPSWQLDAGCARRTVSDVSAVADPNTGVAVYDSYAYRGASGWMVFGGTSASAPIVASVFAMG